MIGKCAFYYIIMKQKWGTLIDIILQQEWFR